MATVCTKNDPDSRQDIARILLCKLTDILPLLCGVSSVRLLNSHVSIASFNTLSQRVTTPIGHWSWPTGAKPNIIDCGSTISIEFCEFSLTRYLRQEMRFIIKYAIRHEYFVPHLRFIFNTKY